MKTRLIHHLLAALLGVALTATLHAQTSAFTYQGQLTDNGGPANGTYDLAFSLWDGLLGSQVGGTITNQATAVSNGLFTVTLDFGAARFDGNPRLLEIGVATNGSGAFNVLTPRQPITSSPYAIRAGNAGVAASAASVAAGNITGTLTTAQLPATVLTNGASGVSISGTFSGDGTAITNVDLLRVNSRGAIQFNELGGQFTLSASPSVGNNPLAVMAADLNGDNWPDLVSANRDSSSLSILTNDSGGGLVLASSISVGTPYDITIADVNGDDSPDLISPSFYTSSLNVLTNNGHGQFALSATPPASGNPTAVAAADINGDDLVDLISAGGGFRLTVVTNNGAGGFAQSASITVGDKLTDVVAADMNGDTKVDLVTYAFRESTLHVLTNNGSGGFAQSWVAFVPTGEFLAAADFNRDGRMDLISDSGSSLTLFTNNGNGGFSASSVATSGSYLGQLTAVDVNGDGWADVVGSDTAGPRLLVLTNDTLGGFAVCATLPLGTRPSGVATADINGDGGAGRGECEPSRQHPGRVEKPGGFVYGRIHRQWCRADRPQCHQSHGPLES